MVLHHTQKEEVLYTAIPICKAMRIARHNYLRKKGYFVSVSDSDPHGSALMLLRIGNADADLDSGAMKLAKINK